MIFILIIALIAGAAFLYYKKNATKRQRGSSPRTAVPPSVRTALPGPSPMAESTGPSSAPPGGYLMASPVVSGMEMKAIRQQNRSSTTTDPNKPTTANTALEISIAPAETPVVQAEQKAPEPVVQKPSDSDNTPENAKTAREISQRDEPTQMLPPAPEATAPATTPEVPAPAPEVAAPAPEVVANPPSLTGPAPDNIPATATASEAQREQIKNLEASTPATNEGSKESDKKKDAEKPKEVEKPKEEKKEKKEKKSKASKVKEPKKKSKKK